MIDYQTINKMVEKRNNPDVGNEEHREHLCGQTFEDVRGHVRQVHSLVGKSICKLCDKSFRDNSLLKRHVDGVHKVTLLMTSHIGKDWSQKQLKIEVTCRSKVYQMIR